MTESKYRTCYMIDRVEADAKSSHLQRVALLPAPRYLLDAVPVLGREHRVVVHVQSGACGRGHTHTRMRREAG